MKLSEVISKKDFYSFSTIIISLNMEIDSGCGVATYFHQFGKCRCNYDAIKDIDCLSITIDNLMGFSSLNICLLTHDFDDVMYTDILCKPIKIESKYTNKNLIKSIMKKIYRFSNDKFSVCIEDTIDGNEEVTVFTPHGVNTDIYYNVAYDVELGLLKKTVDKAINCIQRIFIQERKEGIKVVELYSSPASIIHFGELMVEEKRNETE